MHKELIPGISWKIKVPESQRADLFSCYCGLRLSDIYAMQWNGKTLFVMVDNVFD